MFFAFGTAGLLVAVLFWLLVRDRPSSLPGADRDVSLPLSKAPLSTELGLVLRSRNMWLSGTAQFGTNFGWAFLVTLLPTYLVGAFKVTLEERGRMQSVALMAGCVGMVMGGFLTDGLRRRLGPRWGRSLPAGTTHLGCAAACCVLPFLTHPWEAVAVLASVAFLVDLGVPALWAFNQDVGGRSAGTVCGWGNMWGNLGAAVSPVVLTIIHRASGWEGAFAACAGGFALSSACGFLLDATRPVNPDLPPTHADSRPEPGETLTGVVLPSPMLTDRGTPEGPPHVHKGRHSPQGGYCLL